MIKINTPRQSVPKGSQVKFPQDALQEYNLRVAEEVDPQRVAFNTDASARALYKAMIGEPLSDKAQDTQGNDLGPGWFSEQEAWDDLTRRVNEQGLPLDANNLTEEDARTISQLEPEAYDRAMKELRNKSIASEWVPSTPLDFSEIDRIRETERQAIKEAQDLSKNIGGIYVGEMSDAGKRRLVTNKGRVKGLLYQKRVEDRFNEAMAGMTGNLYPQRLRIEKAIKEVLDASRAEATSLNEGNIARMARNKLDSLNLPKDLESIVSEYMENEITKDAIRRGKATLSSGHRDPEVRQQYEKDRQARKEGGWIYETMNLLGVDTSLTDEKLFRKAEALTDKNVGGINKIVQQFITDTRRKGSDKTFMGQKSERRIVLDPSFPESKKFKQITGPGPTNYEVMLNDFRIKKNSEAERILPSAITFALGVVSSQIKKHNYERQGFLPSDSTTLEQFLNLSGQEKRRITQSPELKGIPEEQGILAAMRKAVASQKAGLIGTRESERRKVAKEKSQAVYKSAFNPKGTQGSSPLNDQAIMKGLFQTFHSIVMDKIHHDTPELKTKPSKNFSGAGVAFQWATEKGYIDWGVTVGEQVVPVISEEYGIGFLDDTAILSIYEPSLRNEKITRRMPSTIPISENTLKELGQENNWKAITGQSKNYIGEGIPSKAFISLTTRTPHRINPVAFKAIVMQFDEMARFYDDQVQMMGKNPEYSFHMYSPFDPTAPLSSRYKILFDVIANNNPRWNYHVRKMGLESPDHDQFVTLNYPWIDHPYADNFGFGRQAGEKHQQKSSIREQGELVSEDEGLGPDNLLAITLATGIHKLVEIEKLLNFQEREAIDGRKVAFFPNIYRSEMSGRFYYDEPILNPIDKAFSRAVLIPGWSEKFKVKDDDGELNKNIDPAFVLSKVKESFGSVKNLTHHAAGVSLDRKLKSLPEETLRIIDFYYAVGKILHDNSMGRALPNIKLEDMREHEQFVEYGIRNFDIAAKAGKVFNDSLNSNRLPANSDPMTEENTLLNLAKFSSDNPLYDSITKAGHKGEWQQPWTVLNDAYRLQNAIKGPDQLSLNLDSGKTKKQLLKEFWDDDSLSSTMSAQEYLDREGYIPNDSLFNFSYVYEEDARQSNVAEISAMMGDFNTAGLVGLLPEIQRFINANGKDQVVGDLRELMTYDMRSMIAEILNGKGDEKYAQGLGDYFQAVLDNKNYNGPKLIARGPQIAIPYGKNEERLYSEAVELMAQTQQETQKYLDPLYTDNNGVLDHKRRQRDMSQVYRMMAVTHMAELMNWSKVNRKFGQALGTFGAPTRINGVMDGEYIQLTVKGTYVVDSLKFLKERMKGLEDPDTAAVDGVLYKRVKSVPFSGAIAAGVKSQASERRRKESLERVMITIQDRIASEMKNKGKDINDPKVQEEIMRSARKEFDPDKVPVEAFSDEGLLFGSAFMRSLGVDFIQNIDATKLALTWMVAARGDIIGEKGEGRRGNPPSAFAIHDAIISTAGSTLLLNNAYNNIAPDIVASHGAHYLKRLKELLLDNYVKEIPELLDSNGEWSDKKKIIGSDLLLDEKGRTINNTAIARYFDYKWYQQKDNFWVEEQLPRTYINFAGEKTNKTIMDQQRILKDSTVALLETAKSFGWKDPEESIAERSFYKISGHNFYKLKTLIMEDLGLLDLTDQAFVSFLKRAKLYNLMGRKENDYKRQSSKSMQLLNAFVTNSKGTYAQMRGKSKKYKEGLWSGKAPRSKLDSAPNIQASYYLDKGDGVPPLIDELPDDPPF